MKKNTSSILLIFLFTMLISNYFNYTVKSNISMNSFLLDKTKLVYSFSGEYNINNGNPSLDETIYYSTMKLNFTDEISVSSNSTSAIFNKNRIITYVNFSRFEYNYTIWEYVKFSPTFYQLEYYDENYIDVGVSSNLEYSKREIIRISDGIQTDNLLLFGNNSNIVIVAGYNDTKYICDILLDDDQVGYHSLFYHSGTELWSLNTPVDNVYIVTSEGSFEGLETWIIRYDWSFQDRKKYTIREYEKSSGLLINFESNDFESIEFKYKLTSSFPLYSAEPTSTSHTISNTTSDTISHTTVSSSLESGTKSIQEAISQKKTSSAAITTPSNINNTGLSSCVFFISLYTIVSINNKLKHESN